MPIVGDISLSFENLYCLYVGVAGWFPTGSFDKNHRPPGPVDRGDLGVLVLLDLTLAFYTPSIAISCCCVCRIPSESTELRAVHWWFRSRLVGRTQLMSATPRHSPVVHHSPALRRVAEIRSGAAVVHFIHCRPLFSGSSCMTGLLRTLSDVRVYGKSRMVAFTRK